MELSNPAAARNLGIPGQVWLLEPSQLTSKLTYPFSFFQFCCMGVAHCSHSPNMTWYCLNIQYTSHLVYLFGDRQNEETNHGCQQTQSNNVPEKFYYF